MAQIVDAPIEFRCPVCGKITVIMGGEGNLGPSPIIWRGKYDEKDLCHCGKEQKKKQG